MPASTTSEPRTRPKARAARKGRQVRKESRSRYAEPKRLNLQSGELERDYSKRPRRWQGAQANQPLPAPKSPDPRIVSEEECHVCGERYKRWSESGCTFQDAAAQMSEGPPGAAYKSRGPILWRMRVCKLSEWYARHQTCAEWERDPDTRRMRIPKPMIWSLLHGDGEIPAKVKLTRRQAAWIDDLQRAMSEAPVGATWDEWGEDEPIPF